jgi:hypothetical protein
MPWKWLMSNQSSNWWTASRCTESCCTALTGLVANSEAWIAIWAGQVRMRDIIIHARFMETVIVVATSNFCLFLSSLKSSRWKPIEASTEGWSRKGFSLLPFKVLKTFRGSWDVRWQVKCTVTSRQIPRKAQPAETEPRSVLWNWAAPKELVSRELPTKLDGEFIVVCWHTVVSQESPDYQERNVGVAALHSFSRVKAERQLVDTIACRQDAIWAHEFHSIPFIFLWKAATL